MPRSIPLTEKEIFYYHSLLQEEITSYNCGKLCTSPKDPVPFCCNPENAVPFLFRNEFSGLSKKTDLWSLWKPKTKQGKELKKKSEDKDMIFCECRGIAFCERENRSISCRTFPLEPYIDENGVYSGLIFMKEFLTKCPLGEKLSDIRQEFIDNHYSFWEKIMFRKKTEEQTYIRSSRIYRSWAKKKNTPLPLLIPSHLK